MALLLNNCAIPISSYGIQKVSYRCFSPQTHALSAGLGQRWNLRDSCPGHRQRLPQGVYSGHLKPRQFDSARLCRDVEEGWCLRSQAVSRRVYFDLFADHCTASLACPTSTSFAHQLLLRLRSVSQRMPRRMQSPWLVVTRARPFCLF